MEQKSEELWLVKLHNIHQPLPRMTKRIEDENEVYQYHSPEEKLISTPFFNHQQEDKLSFVPVHTSLPVLIGPSTPSGRPSRVHIHSAVLSCCATGTSVFFSSEVAGG